MNIIKMSNIRVKGQKVSQGAFSDTLIRLDAFKRTTVFRPKIDFFPRVGAGFWVKNDQMEFYDAPRSLGTKTS